MGNRPPKKLVGTWWDKNQVELSIGQNGIINYNKQKLDTTTHYKGPARFKDDGFVCGVSFARLEGKYIEEEGSPPKLIANGIVLTKRR